MLASLSIIFMSLDRLIGLCRPFSSNELLWCGNPWIPGFKAVSEVTNSNLDDCHYHARRNFQGAWFSNSEIVDQLLKMSEELQASHNYYQALIDVVDNQRAGEMQTLLNQKLTTLPSRSRGPYACTKMKSYIV